MALLHFFKIINILNLSDGVENDEVPREMCQTIAYVAYGKL